MMTQYLILHKVRGEPAFDVAERIQIGDEEGWIIPTSGHRAYPYWHLPLEDLAFDFDAAEMSFDGHKWKDVTDVPPLPAEWPDHYEAVEERAVAKKGMGLDIWSVISRPEPKLIRRRV
jgi:hypothetical protein